MAGLTGNRIVVGVTGGIAAYKAADVVSRLVQAGADVDVILTASARRFIGSATFQALTQRSVHDDLFEPWFDDYTGHISLGHNADALLVVPATAHTIARLATGLADDMLGAVALTTRAPLVIAPAMEHEMFHHPATQENVARLRDRGATLIGPDHGRLASGVIGDGRLASPERIVGGLRWVLGRSGPLQGRHVVVTAGGTQEPLDPIRFIGNRSSGRMGYALAQATIDAGAEVTLISTPTMLIVPEGAMRIPVATATEMQSAVSQAVKTADVLIMAAAVADFRPFSYSEAKLKKSEHGLAFPVELVRNPDIVGSVDRPGLLKIGFAAETEHLLEHARSKLVEKGLALIIANDAVSTIGSATTAATLIPSAGPEITLPVMPKEELAALIVDRIADLLHESPRVS